ncbi:MAG: BON domain-containing protein [Nitrospirota bacterium]
MPIVLLALALPAPAADPGPAPAPESSKAPSGEQRVIEQRQPESKSPEAPAAKPEGQAKPDGTPKPDVPAGTPAKTREPTPPWPAGSTILKVKLALMADSRLFPYEIDVDLHGSEAVLAGKVSSQEEKLAATEVASRVGGVKSVSNLLEVAKGLHATLARKQDEIITQYVKDRFAKSKTLEAANFDVKTENGIVSLSGTTRFQVIVLEAAEAARQVPGVRAVHTDAVRVSAGD